MCQVKSKKQKLLTLQTVKLSLKLSNPSNVYYLTSLPFLVSDPNPLKPLISNPFNYQSLQQRKDI